MSDGPKYYLVEASALPEVFIKAAEARKLFDTGECPTVSQAVSRAGISRSAFYKYKDSVFPFYDMAAGRIVTFYAKLKNEPGVLSGILNILAQNGANILTISQGIPVDGSAAVTISAETAGLVKSVEDVLEQMTALSGVIKSGVLAG